MILVSGGAVGNEQSGSNLFDRRKMGHRESILTTSFHFYVSKLHYHNYTLQPLIKRRNRGVVLLILHSFHSYFSGNPRPGRKTPEVIEKITPAQSPIISPLPVCDLYVSPGKFGNEMERMRVKLTYVLWDTRTDSIKKTQESKNCA